MSTNQFINGNTIYGVSQLERAVQNVLKQGVNSDLNMKNHKITNLAIPTNDLDATNKAYVDTKVAQGDPTGLVALNSINAVYPLTGNLDLRNSSKTIKLNSTDITKNEDAVNVACLLTQKDLAIQSAYMQSKNYTDAQITTEQTAWQSGDSTTLSTAQTYTDNKKLNQFGVTGDINMGLHQVYSYVTNPDLDAYCQTWKTLEIAEAKASAVQSTCEAYTDNAITTYNNSSTLKSTIDNEISQYSVFPITIQDKLANIIYLQQNYIQDTSTLDQINKPVANVDMNNHQLINLSDPTLNQNAATKNYVDSSITNNLTDAEQYTDTRLIDYYNKAKVESIVASSEGSMLAQAQTNGDARYYQNTVPLQSITKATADLDVNNHKVVNVSNGTNNNDAVNKSQLDSVAASIPTVDSTQIHNSTSKSKILCSGDNQIDLYSNNVNIGKIYQPTGQSTTPLGLYRNDKIQIQSQLNSFGLYGGQALSALPTLNTNGLYITGVEDSTKNAQQLINLSQGTAQLNMSAGHSNLATGSQQNYAAVSANSSLLISGGTPITNPSIYCYSTSKASTLGTNLPIQFTGKTGQSATTSITEANQFASKAYVDSSAGSGGLPSTSTLNSIATTNPTSGSVSMNNQKITNLATPTATTDAVTKAYADSLIPAASQPAEYISLICSSTFPALNGYFADANWNVKKSNTNIYMSYDSATGGIILNPGTYIIQTSFTAFNTNATLIYLYDVISGNRLCQQLLGINPSAMGTLDPWVCELRVYNNGANQWHSGTPSIICQVTSQIKIRPQLVQAAPVSYNTYMLQVQQIPGSQILQANSIYSSNLLFNSGLDLQNTYRISNCLDPVNAQDVATKNWVTNNTITGSPGKIQNATATTSSLTANTTELTNGSFPLNMNTQKITSLANGTLASDACTYGQLTSYLYPQLQNGVNNVLLQGSGSSGTLLVYGSGGSGLPVIQARTDGSTLNFYEDIDALYGFTTGKLFRYTTINRHSLNVPVLISSTYSAGTATTNPALSIDSSTMSYNSATSTTPLVLIKPNTSTYTQGLQLQNCNLSVYSDAQSFIMGASASYDSAVSASLTMNHSTFTFDLFCQKGITSASFVTYTPGSSRNYKRNISIYTVPDDIEQIQAVTYQYDKDKCDEVGLPLEQADCDLIRNGFLYQDVPDRYKVQRTEQIVSIDIDSIRRDMLYWHHQQINSMKLQFTRKEEEYDSKIQFLQDRLNNLEQRFSAIQSALSLLLVQQT